MNIRGFLALTVCLIMSAFSAFAQSEYTIKSGDSVTIEVLEDSSLNRTVVVLPDGRFSFPYAGSVRASGRTISQVAAAVRDGISSNFTVEPTVFVSVNPAPPAPAVAVAPAAPVTISIFFVGEVSSPGEKALQPGTTFLQALSNSGGFSNFAATKRIQLRRTDPATGLQSVFQIDYRALSDGAVLQNDFPLQDGDVILVPERRLFE